MDTSRYRKNGEHWTLVWVGIFLGMIAIIVTASLVFRPVGYYQWYPFGFGWIWVPFALFFLFFAFRWFFWWGWGYRSGYWTGDDAYYTEGEVRKRRDYEGAVRADVTRFTGARRDMSTNPRARVVILGVLELIVGGIVVLGGAALVYFSNDATGMSLGVVHAILGLSAFPVAFLLLTGKVGARTLALGVDAVIIVFSAVSEITLSTTGSLSSGPFFDSVVGTSVAVLIAAVIVYLLMNPSLRPLQAANTKSAGQVTRSRANKTKGHLL